MFVAMLDPPDGIEDAMRPVVIPVRGDQVLLEQGATDLPVVDDANDLVTEHGERHFLGVLDDRAVWAVDVPPGGEPTGDAAFESLYFVHDRLGEERWALAGRAVQVVEWGRTHRFCGRCATATQPVRGERAMRCPDCGLLLFPRLAPAIIVLVTRGDRILLARGRQFAIPMYSTLAGFVEPGESVEQAVHREVKEEVGIDLTDVRYFASQPWPFPNSLMLGFTAAWAGGDLVLEEAEIVDADWFHPDDLPNIPPPMSISRWLIDSFLEAASD